MTVFLITRNGELVYRGYEHDKEPRAYAYADGYQAGYEQALATIRATIGFADEPTTPATWRVEWAE